MEVILENIPKFIEIKTLIKDRKIDFANMMRNVPGKFAILSILNQNKILVKYNNQIFKINLMQANIVIKIFVNIPKMILSTNKTKKICRVTAGEIVSTVTV